MRNRFISTVFLLVMPFTMLFGQNYNKLWEAVREAEAKDLPKTQMEALQKIVDKATRDDDYGQLLKAGLQQAKVQLNISPDSLDRIISDLERQALAYEHTQPVMAAVLNAVLGQVYCSDSRYGDEQHSKGMACFEKSLSKPLMLAATKTKEYEPFVEKGIDSRMFNHDLLSVIGYHAAENGYSEAYRIMHKFYKEQGMEVPEGWPGSNPGELSQRSEVHIKGRLR